MTFNVLIFKKKEDFYEKKGNKFPCRARSSILPENSDCGFNLHVLLNARNLKRDHFAISNSGIL